MALQVVTVAVVPLNLTVAVPWVAPKFVPAIVTGAATAPDVGDRLVMLGAATTAKLLPALATPATVTTTFPEVAPTGTVATMLVALHVVTAAVVVLNLTVLVPCVAPKFEPAIVTDAPTAADAGVSVVIVGAAAATAGSTTRNSRKTTSVRADTKFAETRRARDRGHNMAASFCSQTCLYAGLTAKGRRRQLCSRLAEWAGSVVVGGASMVPSNSGFSR